MKDKIFWNLLYHWVLRKSKQFTDDCQARPTLRGSSVKNFPWKLCLNRQPRRDIAYYPDKIGHKLTKNQRVKHTNFSCFERQYPGKICCLNTNPESLTSDVGHPILNILDRENTFSLSIQWIDHLYCKNDARFNTRTQKRCCLALDIAHSYFFFDFSLLSPTKSQ